MHREPDVGLDPGSPGSRPGPKAGAKPLRHPGIPQFVLYQDSGVSLVLPKRYFSCGDISWSCRHPGPTWLERLRWLLHTLSTLMGVSGRWPQLGRWHDAASLSPCSHRASSSPSSSPNGHSTLSLQQGSRAPCMVIQGSHRCGPGVLKSSPALGSPQGARSSLCLCLCLSLYVSLE